MSWLDRNIPEKRDRNADAVLEIVDNLDPDDHSERAEYLREVAEDVRDQRGQR